MGDYENSIKATDDVTGEASAALVNENHPADQKPVIVNSMMACTEAFAVPGEGNIIDMIREGSDPKISWYEAETLEQIRLRYPGAEVVNVDEWCKAKAAQQDSEVKWTKITEDRYMETLEVLPPAYMIRYGFLVGEPSDHHATSGQPRFAAFRHRRGGDYWEASRPMTIPEFKESLVRFMSGLE